MSIEITGPEKFDFQDLVCVELALRFLGGTNLRLVIEPAGHEDAELTIERDGLECTFEVQVKGSAKEVTLETLAVCLAHFPGLKATNCLLERLVACERRFTVLVMSGRCKDTASPFVIESGWKGKPHKHGAIKAKTTKALLEEFRKLESKRSTSLEKRVFGGICGRKNGEGAEEHRTRDSLWK